MSLKLKVLIFLVILANSQSELITDEVIEIQSEEELSLVKKYVRRPGMRIRGGVPAARGEVPYQVAFKRKETYNGLYTSRCGGTIVKESVIVSAAHCFENDRSFCCKKGYIKGSSVRHFYAVAGTTRNAAHYSNDDGQWRQLDHIKYPENYDFPHDDIALVKTKTPFVFNKFVSAVPYATLDKEPKDIRGLCRISGFGEVAEKKQADNLLMGYTQIIPARHCMMFLRRNMKDLFCTGNAPAEVTKGDSGGPLVCKETDDPKENGSGVLVGVTSGYATISVNGMFIMGSAVFTRVSAHTEFLNAGCSWKINNSAMFSFVCLFILVLLNSLFFTCLNLFLFSHNLVLYLLKHIQTVKGINYRSFATKMLHKLINYGSEIKVISVDCGVKLNFFEIFHNLRL